MVCPIGTGDLAILSLHDVSSGMFPASSTLLRKVHVALMAIPPMAEEGLINHM